MDFIGTRADIGSKIMASYQTAAEEKHLSKCSLASYASLGSRSAKLVLASTSPITVKDAKDFVFNDLGHKLIPVAESFVAGSPRNDMGVYYSTIIAHKASYLMEPFDANDTSKTCMNASATVFLDENLGCTWERKTVNGKDCLVRSNEEDIESVLRSCMTASVGIAASASKMKITPAVGDVVTFVGFEGDDGVPFVETGEVTEYDEDADVVTVSVPEDGVSVETEIPAHAIVAAAPLDVNATRQDVLDYLYRAYGPKFKEIVKKTGAFK